MEGLEVSIVNLKEVLLSAETIRFDSEYYLKRYIHSEQLIKENFTSFSKFYQLNLNVDGSAFYPALEPYYNTGDYPFIRVGDVKNYVDFENCVKVPFNILYKYPTLKHVQKGDIVLTKGGTIGLAGLITQKCCVTRDLIFINSSTLDEHEYVTLYLFLSTKFSYQQLIRSSSQSVQPHLTITLVRNLDVFNYSIDFKKYVTGLYKEAISTLSRSKTLYKQAEEILYSGVGLINFKQTKSTTNIKTLAKSFRTSGRLDAEYYQPKFDDLEKFLFENGDTIKLGSHLVTNKRGIQPIYTEFSSGLPVLNSKHIRENRIEYSNNRLGIVEDKTAELIIRKNDVLLNGTGVGTIGRSAVYMRNEPALPDNHVTILRTYDLDPVFLSVQLNSIIGKLQVEKYFKGSSGQIELYPADIDEFIIWKAPKEIQSQIREIIERSENLRLNSEKLLQVAKDAVEIAIEDGEEKALAYIQLNT